MIYINSVESRVKYALSNTAYLKSYTLRVINIYVIKAIFRDFLIFDFREFFFCQARKKLWSRLSIAVIIAGFLLFEGNGKTPGSIKNYLSNLNLRFDQALSPLFKVQIPVIDSPACPSKTLHCFSVRSLTAPKAIINQSIDVIDHAAPTSGTTFSLMSSFDYPGCMAGTML